MEVQIFLWYHQIKLFSLYSLLWCQLVQSVPITSRGCEFDSIIDQIYLVQSYVIKLSVLYRRWIIFSWYFISLINKNTLLSKVSFKLIILYSMLIAEVIIWPYTIRPPRYSWNIVESGVKHHNSYPYYTCISYILFSSIFHIIHILIYLWVACDIYVWL